MVERNEALARLERRVREAAAVGDAQVELQLSILGSGIDHRPEDMTVTVSGGTPLSFLQSVLGEKRQWLPVDPALSDRVTVHELICWNLSGPSRSGLGSVRDYLIGMQMLTGNGDVIRAGGKVVKNVAGYDLCKLAVGSEGSLGWITEAAFKLLPLPEAREAVEWRIDSLDRIEEVAERLAGSGLNPPIFDAHHRSDGDFRLRIGFAGAGEFARREMERALGLAPGAERSETDSTSWLWEMAEERPGWMCVAPSAVFSTVRELGESPWVARLGAGLIFHRSSRRSSVNEAVGLLSRRVKQTFDRSGILPLPSWM